MNILQVTNFFCPSWEAGGPPRVAYEMSKELISRGHNVTVYTTDGFKSKLNVLRNEPVNVDGITTYYFENLSRYLAKKVNLTPYYAPIVALNQIKKFDIIHIHESTLLGFIVYHYAMKYNVPFIFQAHGSIPYLISSKKTYLGQIFNYLVERPILYNAKKVIALNKNEKMNYLKAGINEEKIAIIPNGLDLSNNYSECNKGSFRKEFGISLDEKIILYVGRLNQTKGLDILIEAFANLNEEQKNVKLILLGPDDGYENLLREKINKLNLDSKVIFTNFLSQEMKIKGFLNADVFVTPSFSGFPLTFLEACACGVPIVTTSEGDELEWINEVGFVTKYDANDLKGAITNILADNELKEQFRKHGYLLIQNEFNWNRIVDIIEKLYYSIIV